MTDIDRTKTWRLHPDGHLLGYRHHVSPYGGIAWATVDLDTNEVIALEHPHPYREGDFLAGASCPPHQLVVPPGALNDFPKKEKT